MKIAVYTIALNEEQFVERWHSSAKDADLLLIADTGSTDNTIHIAEKLGIKVIQISINPWRFDHARNAALDALPDDIDIAIALDMDEVLQPDWRWHLEHMPPMTTRPRYKYIWSWNADGSEGLTYHGDKIHSRHGYRWKHPVHEVLTPENEEVQHWVGLEIHHYPDHKKSRSQYLPLLELAVNEDPDDDRNAFYFARELYFRDDRDRAVGEFKRHLALPRATWEPERAASMRYLAKLQPNDHERWLLRAAAEAPGRREPWVELACYYHLTHNWPACYSSAKRALTIQTKPLEYLCETEAWGALPHDLAAIAAWNLGLYDEAARHGKIAHELDPNDVRLVDNLKFYEARVTKTSS